MPRLEFTEPAQHGHRTGSAGGTRSAPKGITRGSRKKTKKQKKRTYLSKDDQAALLVKFMELPKASKVKTNTARADALVELVKEYDVCIDYPQRLYNKIKEEGKLSTRDGVAGAPKLLPVDRLAAAEAEELQDHQVHHADQGGVRQLSAGEARRPFRYEVSRVQVHHRG